MTYSIPTNGGCFSAWLSSTEAARLKRSRRSTSVEAAAVRRAHAQYNLALAEHAAPSLTTGAQAFWLERLDLEQETSAPP